MKQQVDGKQMPRGPWKYLTAQTSKQQEMDTNSLERLQRPGYTARQLTAQLAHQHNNAWEDT